MKDERKKNLRKAALVGAGVAGGVAVAGLSSPFVRSELRNFLRTRGRVHSGDFSKVLPAGAKDDAKKVLKALKERGVDLGEARVAVTGAGGTGKTVLSKALAEYVPRSQTTSRGVHVHGNPHRALDHEIRRKPWGWDFSGYQPQKGTISEQTHLLAQEDPDKFDILVHLEKPVKVVRDQLLGRGKGATQYLVEDYPLLQRNLRNAFEQADGEVVQVAPHIKVKLRPAGGSFMADKNLDAALKSRGLTAPSGKREDKLLTLSTGRSSVYRGIPSYFRKGPTFIAAAAGAAGGAVGYGVNEKLGDGNYRRESLGDAQFLLDREISLVKQLPKDPRKLESALKRHIEKAKSTRWSHAQIAIPSSVDLRSFPGANRTRLAIPLPGESLGTPSVRIGNLHAHTQGPVHLVHQDSSAPTNLRAVLHHIPESLAAIKMRLSGAEPFVKDAAQKLKVVYIDETGAGHRAQANNVVRAARKMGIEAESVDFTDTFLRRRADGKEYRAAYVDFLKKKKVSTLPRLVRAHLGYHGGVDARKKAKFLRDAKDSAILLAHPHLEYQFRDVARPISVMHTDPVKWPVSFSPSTEGRRLHIGTAGVVGDMNAELKKEVSGLAVHPDLLKKRMSRSGLMGRGKFNVTVSAGGEALEVPEMAEQILKSDLPGNAEVHAVAGRRKDVFRRLQRMAKKDQRLKVHGFAPLPKMMREADLNVIRAHGTSYAETLTSGKPAVYYGPSLDLVDIQGTLTRRTAVYGGKVTKNPVAVGLENIPVAIAESRRNYAGLRAQAEKMQREYGDPASQIAAAAVKEARAPRDYKKEYAEYHAKPEQVGNRSLRNQARRKLGLKNGDPREVDHKTPISKGGGNGHGNLRAVSFELNRQKAARMEKDAGISAAIQGLARMGSSTGTGMLAGFGRSLAKKSLSGLGRFAAGRGAMEAVSEVAPKASRKFLQEQGLLALNKHHPAAKFVPIAQTAAAGARVPRRSLWDAFPQIGRKAVQLEHRVTPAFGPAAHNMGKLMHDPQAAVAAFGGTLASHAARGLGAKRIGTAFSTLGEALPEVF
jgi:hypothetical protein